MTNEEWMGVKKLYDIVSEGIAEKAEGGAASSGARVSVYRCGLSIRIDVRERV